MVGHRAITVRSEVTGTAISFADSTGRIGYHWHQQRLCDCVAVRLTYWCGNGTITTGKRVDLIHVGHCHCRSQSKMSCSLGTWQDYVLVRKGEQRAMCDDV